MKSLRAAFTLIELMITIVIASIVILAVYAMFLVQMRTYLAHDIQSELMSNLRYAQETVYHTLSRTGGLFDKDGLAVGALGTSTTTSFGQGGFIDEDLAVLPISSVNAADGEGTDWVYSMGGDPEVLFFTTWGDTAGSDGKTCDTTALWSNADGDLIGLWYAGPSAALLSYVGIQERTARLADGGYGYLICQNFADPSGARSYLWKIGAGGVGMSGDIAVDTNTQKDWVEDSSTAAAVTDADANRSCRTDLPPVLACSALSIHGFYIADYNGIPALMMAEDGMYDNDINTSFIASGPDVDRDLPLLENALNFQVQAVTTPTGDPATDAFDDDLHGLMTDADTLKYTRLLRVMIASESGRDLPTGANAVDTSVVLGASLFDGDGYAPTESLDIAGTSERLVRHMVFDVRMASMPGGRDLQ